MNLGVEATLAFWEVLSFWELLDDEEIEKAFVEALGQVPLLFSFNEKTFTGG